MPAKWSSNSIAGMELGVPPAPTEARFSLRTEGRQSAGPIAALFASGRKSLAAWPLL